MTINDVWTALRDYDPTLAGWLTTLCADRGLRVVKLSFESDGRGEQAYIRLAGAVAEIDLEARQPSPVDPRGYLGAIGAIPKGGRMTGCRDLADGEYSQDTWNRIDGDIADYLVWSSARLGSRTPNNR